jgi:putative heme-binding domain-containing protein
MNRLFQTLTPLLALAIPSFAQLADQATPVEKIKLAKGFKAELLYSVPKEQQGSWVAMTQDDKGRLITSDQYGALFRITPPAIGGNTSDTKVEKLSIDFGHCQGLLYAFGALYGIVNDEAYQGRGLYRCKDTNGDDQFDTVEQLKSFPGKAGEHGPHGLVVGPDGQSIYCVSGNQTPVPPMDTSRVPQNWAEDQLSPMLLGRGFMRDVLAPGGWVAKTDPDGKKWELINTGTRNTYDIAFNRQGDLFGFDADMEWDTNTPWYRPTRVCMMQSGGEFGWRTCSKKWPVRWEDSLPPVVDIGPGSPTGVAFGYGAKFPAKYQDALYIMDWSYGKLYAVHLAPNGTGYTGTAEEFMSASPLPVTDLVIGNKDGAMYVSVGGRKVQSGLYRVTYVGSEKTESVLSRPMDPMSPNVRGSLEAFHGKQDPKAIEAAWPHLSSPDRLIRFAARIAVEHQPIDSWKDKALSEKDPQTSLLALMALIRCTKNADLQPQIIAALNRIDLKALKGISRNTLIRDYWLTVSRHGEPNDELAKTILDRLSPLFPLGDSGLDRDLCELLVMLGDKTIVARAAPLVTDAPTQEEQIDYARILRMARDGWTPEIRTNYFKWFTHAANYKGGASFNLFLDEIKQNAVATLSDAEKAALKEVLEAKPDPKAPSFTSKPMQFVKAWTLDELTKSLGVGLEGNRNFANGRNVFGAATCFACHRFNQEGGTIGPDLTSVAGKYSPRDLLEHILDPSKEISDQYGSTVFTLKDGSTVSGRIANMKETKMMVCTNMMDPNNFTDVDTREVVKTEENKVSMMPPGLLYMLKEDDILDLLAYLLSKGNPEDPLFVK